MAVDEAIGLAVIDAGWQALPDLPSSLLGDGARATNLYVVPAGAAHVLTVGAGKEFSSLSSAIAVSHDGDVIEVDAGTYVNDSATIHDKITIEGVGGVVNLVDTTPLANGKGILVVDNDVTIANVWFSGAQVTEAAGGNGAGIRYEGGNMALVNDVFTNNQDGILATPVLGLPINTVTIADCTFSDNGNPNPSSRAYGYTHDAYINGVNTLTVTDSVFAGVAGVGHELKSRALVANITDNVLADEDSTASYTVDLPDGGNDTLTGNYIEQGARSPNNAIMGYSEEGTPYAGSALTLKGNTIVNLDASSGSKLILNPSIVVANITGNTIVGLAEPQFSPGAFTASNNVNATGTALPDSTKSQILPAGYIAFTDSAPHSITLSRPNTGVIGGAGLITVTDTGAFNAAIGGSGGIVFTAAPNTGHLSVVTAADSINTINFSNDGTIDCNDGTIYSQGTDTIALGTGKEYVTITGTAAITGGAGPNYITVDGAAALGGVRDSDFITVGSGGSIAIGGSAQAVKVSSSGGTFTINEVVAGVGACAASVAGGVVGVQSYSGALNFRTSGGLLQGTTMHLGAESDNVLSHAADTIYAGSGNDMLQLCGGGQTVCAGTGALAIFGAGINPNADAVVFGNGGTYTINGSGGNIKYIGGDKASTVNDLMASVTLVGGAGHLTVNGGARDTITGGAGGLTVNNIAASSITTAAGSSNVLALTGSNRIDSYGNDVINAGSATQNITLHGTSTLTSSAGSSLFTVLGADRLTLTGGTDQVAVGPDATAIVTSAAYTHVNDAGGSLTYTADAAGDNTTATLSGGAAALFSTAHVELSVVTAAGRSTTVGLSGGRANISLRGADTLNIGNASAKVSTSAGGDVINAGSGALSISDTDRKAADTLTVHGASGAITITTAVSSRLVFIGGSGTVVINDWSSGGASVTAGSGSTTVASNRGALQFTAGSGTDTVLVGTGGGTFTFGKGATTVTESVPWGAADIFKFVAGQGGDDIIKGFKLGKDQLSFQGVSVTSQTISAGSTNLRLSDNTHVTLLGLKG